VGKCPRCGARIEVAASSVEPDAIEESTTKDAAVPAGGYGVAFEPDRAAAPRPERPSQGTKRAGSFTAAVPVRPVDVGPIRAPARLEVAFTDSLVYPLWSWSSVGLLAFLPFLLTAATAPLKFLIQSLFSDSAFVVPAYVTLIPTTGLLVFTLGYLVIYLGEILLRTASGEVLPPRPPGIDAEFFRVLRLWASAFASGALLVGLPAWLYWTRCGEVDWIDRVVLLDFALAGAATTQLALISALLHDDPLAANPLTAFAALGRLGWGYLQVTCLTVFVVALLGALLILISRIEDALLHAVASWMWSLATVYLLMVVFRRLGLYCRRRDLLAVWFATRPRWGAGR
jgi:hypothetical protein